jgi:hypothetical protein
LAMGAMQDLDDHGFPSRTWVILSGREDTTSTALKHLPLVQSQQIDAGFGGTNPLRDGQQQTERRQRRGEIQRQKRGMEDRMTSNAILRHALSSDHSFFRFSHRDL